MKGKVAKVCAFIALGFILVFTVTLIISLIGIGGWTVTGIVIGSGVMALFFFIAMKILMKKDRQEKEVDESGGSIKKTTSPFDNDMLEPDEKK